MASDTIQEPGMLILHLSLNATVAERSVFFGWRDQIAFACRRTKACVGKTERIEYLLFGPVGERFAGQDFECLAEQNETGIGVLRPGTGFRLKRQFETGSIECGGICDVAIKLHVTWQA